MANSRGRHRKEGRVRRARPESRCTQPGELPTDSLASVTPSREPSRGALIQICAGPWDKAAFVLEGDTRTLICKRRDLQSLHEDPGRKTQLCSRELPLPPHASAMTTEWRGPHIGPGPQLHSNCFLLRYPLGESTTFSEIPFAHVYDGDDGQSRPEHRVKNTE